MKIIFAAFFFLLYFSCGENEKHINKYADKNGKQKTAGECLMDVSSFRIPTQNSAKP